MFQTLVFQFALVDSVPFHFIWDSIILLVVTVLFFLGEIINIIQSEEFVICQLQMNQLSRYSLLIHIKFIGLQSSFGY